MEESSLTQFIGHKNTSTFTSLYDNYSPAIFGEILRIVKDHQIAQDLLHDVFIVIWQKGYQFDPNKGRLFTWMLSIVRSKCVDHLRKNGNKRYTDLKESLSEDYAVERKVEFSLLFKNLSVLCPKHLRLLSLIYVYGYTHSEASAETKIPIGTIKTIIHRFIASARQKCTDLEKSL